MARSYAKIHVDIWNDPDFAGLGHHAQVVYLFLLSQPKMRSCGVIDMQPRRWAPKLGIDADTLDQALDTLTASDFIAIDADTEELAVRTFLRHDAGDTKNWKVWTGVWSSLGAVESDRIRTYVAANMPETAFDSKAKPTEPKPPTDPIEHLSDTQSEPNRIGQDTQSIPNRDPIEHQSDTQSEPNGIASGISTSTTTTVSIAGTTNRGAANDEPENEQPAASGVVDQATRLIADYQLTLAHGSHDIDNPDAYRATIERRLCQPEHRCKLRGIAADLGDGATPEQIRDRYLEPEPLASLDDLVPRSA